MFPMDDRRPVLVVNAGGVSRRMGRNKALLPVPPHHEPLILSIARRLAPITAGVLLVANDPAVEEALAPVQPRCFPDAYPNAGPLGGLATALAHLKGWCLCVACDLPFVSAQVAAYLWSLAGEEGARWDVVVPHVHGRPQPLHALYHRRCLPVIQAHLAAGRRRVDAFFEDVRVRVVTEAELTPLDPGLLSFFNANTPEDWDWALEQLKKDA